MMRICRSSSLLLIPLLLLATTFFLQQVQAKTVGPFQVRLHWTPDSCWQDECDEYHEWCLQCEGYNCNEGDVLWIEPCRSDLPPQQLFYWRPISTRHIEAQEDDYLLEFDWGQLRIRAMDPWRRELEMTKTSKTPKTNSTHHKKNNKTPSTSTSIQNANSTTTTPTSTQRNMQSIVTNRMLCLQYERGFKYTLEECDNANPEQWFQGFRESSRPYELWSGPTVNINEEDDYCLNVHHHPRQFEELIHTTCRDAREVSTNLWETVWHDDLEDYDDDVQYLANLERNNDEDRDIIVLSSRESDFDPRRYYRLRDPRRDPQCREDAHCGMCQGHCQSDDECAGSLKCFERDSSNPFETPPGCYGDGTPTVDYCYAADGN